MAKRRSWRTMPEAERDAKASELIGRPATVRFPDFDAFTEWLLDTYAGRIRMIRTPGMQPEERRDFDRAAAAYLYGRDCYHRLELQSHPERWEDAGGSSLLHMIHEIDPDLLATRPANKATNYGMNWLIEILAISERQAGRTPKPPTYHKPTHTCRHSGFSARCERYARLIDPDLPDPGPTLRRSWYIRILNGTKKKKAVDR